MQRSEYWNLNTFDKAKLTWEQLQAFRKVELMIKGVADPKEPEVTEEPPSFHEYAKGFGDTVTVIKFGWNQFEVSEEDAAKIMGITFRHVNEKYAGNESIKKLGESFIPELKKETVYQNFDDLLERFKQEHGDALRRKQAWEAYRKEKEGASNATKEVVDDWNQAQEDVALYNRVNEVRAEYIEMTKGDADLAAQFLDKRFSHEELATYWQLRNELYPNGQDVRGEHAIAS